MTFKEDSSFFYFYIHMLPLLRTFDCPCQKYVPWLFGPDKIYIRVFPSLFFTLSIHHYLSGFIWWNWLCGNNGWLGFSGPTDSKVAIVYKIKYKPGYRSCDLLKNLSALIGGKFIFQKKSFTRFALQSECCNFNQWEEWIYNRSHDL